MSFDALFQPIEIGNVTLKHRIDMSPMNMGFTGPNGYLDDQNTAWYAMRARGGFGLIITECVVMNPHRWRGCEGLNPSLMTDNRYYRYHSKMTEMIHEYNKCKVFVQLSPGWGRQGHPSVESPDCPAGGPSPIPLEVDLRNLSNGWDKQFKRIAPGFSAIIPDIDTFRKLSDEEYQKVRDALAGILHQSSPEVAHTVFGDTPREMTVAEIVDLEDRYAVQAKAAYSLGYDGVEVHAPHGYLLHSFLSPRSNQRHDQYGGSLENRARFLLNIIEKTRKVIGPDKAFGVRLSGDELMPGGITHDEVKQVVSWCRDAGANFFNLSQGCYENPGAAFAPDGEGGFSQWAPGFKEASGGLPVITPSFVTPEAAVAELKTGHTDIISLGRQSIADPFWPAKVKEGRVKDLVKCIRCQRCYMDLTTSNWIRCMVNPLVGKEKHYPELWLFDSALDRKVDKFMEKAKGLPQI